MKKQLLKFLPLISAVLLATSCSKDDDSVQTQNPASQPQTQSGIPFTIRVNTGSTLKKIGYAEDKDPAKAGYYNITFAKDDEQKLEMKVYDGSDLLTTLYLANAATGEFSGTVETAPSLTADLTAEITTGDDQSPTYSNKSLEDLLATCAHTFKSGVFHYGDENIELTDQNAYLAISMSPCCEHEIEINTTGYTVKDGRLWVVIPSNTDIKCTELGLKDMTSAPGVYHTVARQYFTVSSTGKKVYFSKGNLQYKLKPAENENPWQFAPTQYHKCFKDGYTDLASGYPDGMEYTDLFGWGMWLKDESPLKTEEDNSKYLPSITTDFATFTTASAIGSEWETLTGGNSQNPGEWNYLFNSRGEGKYGEGTVDNVHGVILLPDEWTYPADITPSTFTPGASDWANTYTAADWAKMEANGAVFLPAAGYRYGTDVLDVGDYGYYWSSSARGEFYAWYLYFRSDYVDPDVGGGRYYGQSVRLVRRL